MPDIEVRDADGNLLHTYQFIAEELGTLVKNEHLIEFAKLNAIEDELVPEGRAGELTFRIVE